MFQKRKIMIHVLYHADAITDHKYIILFVLERSNDSLEKKDVEGN